MEERRQHKRYSIAYPVEGVSFDSRVPDNLLDISKKGIAFIGKGDVAQDNMINMRLFLKNRMFELNAIVIYVKKKRSGEEFCSGVVESPGRKDIFW